MLWFRFSIPRFMVDPGCRFFFMLIILYHVEDYSYLLFSHMPSHHIIS